jgi:hypothetical protein
MLRSVLFDSEREADGTGEDIVTCLGLLRSNIALAAIAAVTE